MRTLVPVVSVLALAACHREAPTVVRPPNELRVENARGVVLTVKRKACGTGDDAFAEVLRVPSGGAASLPLTDGECVDLIALAPDGQIAGRQDDMHLVPGAVWRVK